MIFRIQLLLRPLLLLILFQNLSVPLLYSQDVEPASNPDLRLAKNVRDSVTGGMPSIGIRSALRRDHRFPSRHAVTTDPLLTILHANLAYDYGLSSLVSIGARAVLPFGLFEDSEEYEVQGYGLYARLYIDNVGAIGTFLTVAPTSYSGSFPQINDRFRGSDTTEYDFSFYSITAGFGHRLIFGSGILAEFTVGGEWFSEINVPSDKVSGDFPINAMTGVYNSTDATLFYYMSLRIGYSW